MKNNIRQSLWLVVSLCIVLVAMYWLPAFKIGGHKLRRVDVLSDVRLQEPDTLDLVQDSLPEVPEVKPAFVDTCRTGMTCIEDYSDSTLRGMTLYYEALDRLAEGGRVRIAVFGDSFIEADIFTADFRAMLQKKYGGCGIGFVPVTSNVNGYRPTVIHSFSGWNTHAVTDTIGFCQALGGIAGMYSLALGPDTYVELKNTSKYSDCLDSCEQAALFFMPKDSFQLITSVNRQVVNDRWIAPDAGLQKASVSGVIRSVRWEVADSDSALFYGMTLDGKQGISVDNFSLRGSSGSTLAAIPASFLKSFNKYRPYDLIILQFGLNVATQKGVRYDYYVKQMKRSIQHLKRCFPQASILVLSVGDRDYKTEEGEVRTMPGVRNLVRYQQVLAAESGVAFWNLFEAMGGNESMQKLVDAKPAMANRDYTHINFKGGRHLARIFFETLEYGKEKYDKKKIYEAE